ncbi:MAG: lysophospholipid acyltransferase family protein [Candidatus Alkaliphilus sp. MAG34]|nr:1-acyl-sn-glycerol-3-phosphate acyltransferase [Clostridiales bacterium]
MLFYRIVKSFAGFLLSLVYRIEIRGKEYIPKEGRGVVSSNHFSLMDPIVIAALLPRKVNYMGKEELFSNRLFASILNKLGVFPVKRGGADIGAVKTALKILNNGEIFGIFPEGTRSKQGEILKAKPGLAMVAIKTKSPVIPVAITGNYKPFSKIKIMIGKPIDLSDYYGKKVSTDEYQKLSQNILNVIRELAI